MCCASIRFIRARFSPSYRLICGGARHREGSSVHALNRYHSFGHWIRAGSSTNLVTPLWRHCINVAKPRLFSPSMTPVASKMAVKAGNNPSDSNRPKKKQKVIPPAVQYRIRIQQAAKRPDNIEDAFEAFEQAKSEGVKLSPDCFVTLLFLAAGGDRWEELVYNEMDRDGHLKTGRLDMCEEILSCLNATGSPPIEMCFTALARRNAILLDGKSALEQARQVVQNPSLSQKLRCFLPALVAFGAQGDAEGAFQVYNEIMEAGLEPGEVEFAKMIQALAKEGRDGIAWESVEDLLLHMSRETAELTSDTIRHLSDLFESGRPPGAWKVQSCEVTEDGYCDSCNAKLEAIDLDEEEYKQFASGIATLASKQEKRPLDFETFVKWLDDNGPYGVVIDAANVAFYGQNFDAGGFSFAQIESVVQRVEKDFPGLAPLVILHVNRTRGHAANSQKAKQLMKSLMDKKSFYAAPHGSNDDWYWMYAAVAAGQHGVLISNDEMRDHLFNMLAPKYFAKWKQRHQMRYSFAGDPRTLDLQNPPPYTRCTQRLLTHGSQDEAVSWMFPAQEGNKWLCAKKIV